MLAAKSRTISVCRWTLASLVALLVVGSASAKEKKPAPCAVGARSDKGACPDGTAVAYAAEPASTLPLIPPPIAEKPKGWKKKIDPRLIVSSPGFRMESDGSSRLWVHVHGHPTVQEYLTPSGITYVLTQSRVPVSNNRHTLATWFFNTPVHDARLRQVKDDVHFMVGLRAIAKPTARVVELIPGQLSALELTFGPGDYERLIPKVPTTVRGKNGLKKAKRSSEDSYDEGPSAP